MFSPGSVTAENVLQSPSEVFQLINDSWDNIPFLYPCQSVLKNGSLCRFRGMVQDMPNPVFYFSKYEVTNKVTGQTEIRSGKFRDTLSCEEFETISFDSPACEHGERRPFLVVPVPAVSEWAQIEPKSDKLSASPANKLLEHSGCTSSSNSNIETKRPLDDMEVDTPENEPNKRHCVEQCGQALNQQMQAQDNKTLKAANFNGCLVFMYDIPDSSIKLNDVIEVVGFVYTDPLPADEDEFEDSYKPPSILTPRLHSVTYRRVTNFNPLIKSVESSKNLDVMSEAASIRADLHLVLSQIFFGDNLIADYLVCHLISQIYHRDETEVILGKFSLNISHLPENYLSKEFYNIMCKILPKVQYLPFSIENFNNCQLLSKKNYKTGHLEQGLLQLSDNTHLIIDETKLSEGKLEDKGVRNVNALCSLIKRQKLDYDFTYYSVGFNTDIPVITLSQTKSLLPSDFQLGLSPSCSPNSSVEESFDAVNKFLSEEMLIKIRNYLSVAANLPFTLPEEFQNTIQEDFVALRQQDSSFSAKELHELLVLARFMTLSYCQTVLTRDIWIKAKDMITSRRARISSC